MSTGAKEQLNLLYHGIAERHHQELFAEVAAWLAEMQGGGWQPIETAPKDKGEILAWPVFGKVEKVYWYQDSRKAVWISNAFHVHPTYWQPLPSPPEQESK